MKKGLLIALGYYPVRKPFEVKMIKRRNKNSNDIINRFSSESYFTIYWNEDTKEIRLILPFDKGDEENPYQATKDCLRSFLRKRYRDNDIKVLDEFIRNIKNQEVFSKV